MAREIVLRKRSRDGNRVCTVYGIPEPSYKFTLETCDDIEATIKDSKGTTVSILSLNAPTSIVSRKGNYNVCIEGIGIGTLYSEWASHPPDPPDPGDECCEELRLKDIDLQLQIDNLRTRINNQNITAGEGISVTKTGDSYTITNTYPGGGSDVDIVAGNNVQVSKSGNSYTISATDTDTITTVKQGTNITVTKNGNEYTVNAVDTITTVKAGTNVTVTKSGNEYTVNATDTDTKPILLQELVATCDIGGIASGTRYPVGTTLEKILRDLLTCTTPPTPTKQYPWFTSEVVNRATAEERWIEFAVDPDAGTHTFDLAKTYEEIPVKFDVPAELAPLTLELYNEIFARWEVNTRDFTISNITRTINGENVSYLRYTDAREVNGASRPVRMTWNP